MKVPGHPPRGATWTWLPRTKRRLRASSFHELFRIPAFRDRRAPRWEWSWRSRIIPRAGKRRSLGGTAGRRRIRRTGPRRWARIPMRPRLFSCPWTRIRDRFLVPAVNRTTCVRDRHRRTWPALRFPRSNLPVGRCRAVECRQQSSVPSCCSLSAWWWSPKPKARRLAGLLEGRCIRTGSPSKEKCETSSPGCAASVTT